MMRAIQDRYYVLSPRSRRLYVVTKDLVCSCLGYWRWQHCYHQTEVKTALERGATVDLARVPWGRRGTP